MKALSKGLYYGDGHAKIMVERLEKITFRGKSKHRSILELKARKIDCSIICNSCLERMFNENPL